MNNSPDKFLIEQSSPVEMHSEKQRILTALSQHELTFPQPQVTVEEVNHLVDLVPNTRTLLANTLGCNVKELINKIEQGLITRKQIIDS